VHSLQQDRCPFALPGEFTSEGKYNRNDHRFPQGEKQAGHHPAATYIPFNVDLKLLGGSSNHTRKPLKD
jgi:hypothetical protein